MGSISLALAGVPFDVTFDDAEASFVDARFGRSRRTSPAPDAISLSITHDPSASFAQPAAIPYPGAALTERGPHLRFERRDLRLDCDRATRTATAIVPQPPTTSGTPVHQPTSLDTPLRLLLSVFLAERDGLLVHATGYADARGAFVFPAAGGTGKTTTANKLPDANVLSDDQVALVRTGRGWEAHALPFVGLWAKATVPRVAPLRALAFLAKSEFPALTPLRPADALARLLACTVEFRTGAAARSTFHRAADLAAAVPAFTLALARDTAVLPYIEQMTSARDAMR